LKAAQQVKHLCTRAPKTAGHAGFGDVHFLPACKRCSLSFVECPDCGLHRIVRFFIERGLSASSSFPADPICVHRFSQFLSGAVSDIIVKMLPVKKCGAGCSRCLPAGLQSGMTADSDGRHTGKGEANMSLINREIPDFSVQAYHNGSFISVSKADVLGRWSVFCFYPADFTFICPTELEDLQEKYADFQENDCEIYSVSCDTHFVHKAWHDSSERVHKVTYPMLADPTHVMAEGFEVYIAGDGTAERGTFIVNPEGRIAAYEVHAGSVGRNAEELLRKLTACRFVYEHDDEVCPAKWHPGEKTLKPSLDLVGVL
jgi:peroxiredoxin